jgi:hypothetical protein
MTLAETFLLLVFMLWYVNRPKLPVDPPTPIGFLKAENKRLKEDLARMEAELADVQRRLEWWRTRFDQPVPGSEEELKRFLFDAGRGKPKCQDDNVLVNVSQLDGVITMTVLADCPSLREAVLDAVDFRPGVTITKPEVIDAVLRATRSFRKNGDQECRFDYRFNYRTHEDYDNVRERFGQYFYTAGRRRTP